MDLDPDALFTALQQSDFAALMRGSTFLYPFANVVHVLGALCFFAAVAAMDFKVFNAETRADARIFISRVRPAAILAFLVMVLSGVMLLAPEALHIWHNPVYRVKLIAIAVGLLNVLLLEAAIRGRPERRPAFATIPAGLSLAVWLMTAGLGRLIAYF
jgi:hypothetical protein